MVRCLWQPVEERFPKQTDPPRHPSPHSLQLRHRPLLSGDAQLGAKRPASEFVEEFEAETPTSTWTTIINDWDTYKNKITTAISTTGAPELVSILLTDVTLC